MYLVTASRNSDFLALVLPMLSMPRWTCIKSNCTPRTEEHLLKTKILANWGGPFLRARFFVRFEDQNRDLLCHIVFSNFIALRPSRPASRPASKLAPKCFVLIPMVSRRWSSRLALRPASNYTSSSKVFVWLQFPYP